MQAASSFPGAYTVEPRGSLAPSQYIMLRAGNSGNGRVRGVGNGIFAPTSAPEINIGSPPTPPGGTMTHDELLNAVRTNFLLPEEIDDAISRGLTPGEYAGIYNAWPAEIKAGGVPSPEQFAARYNAIGTGLAGVPWAAVAVGAAFLWFFFLKKRR